MPDLSTQQRLDLALRKITYGYYLLTTRKDGAELATREADWISAGTVSWVMQSSFEPPLVTVAIQKDSNLNETIGRSRAFALAILGKQDRELIDTFAGESNIAGNKINAIPFQEGQETGAPILDAGIAWLECRLEDTLATPGDHVLFVGRVVASGVRQTEAEPLYEWEAREHYGGSRPG